MTKCNMSMTALVLGIVFSGIAPADTLSKEKYDGLVKTIDGDYDAAKGSCDSLAGNANDICIAEAKGRRSVAKADLEAGYQPSEKTHNDARIARTEAVYAVAIEKCDDEAGNSKDVCMEEAKAARVHGMADAKADLKTSKANAAAEEKTDEANAGAVRQTSEANKDAAVAKGDADYAVATAKCEVLAGGAKDRCVSDAKTRYRQ